MAGLGILAGWLADQFRRHELMSLFSAAGEIFAGLLMLLGAQSFPRLAINLMEKPPPSWHPCFSP
jgi:hypothetical protein